MFFGGFYRVRFLVGRGVFALRLPRVAISALVGTYRRANRLWTAVVVHSEASLRDDIPAEQIDPFRARIIPNGVDLPPTTPEPPRPHQGLPRLLFVGRLEKVKGPDLLFKALEILATEGHPVELTVAGGGSLEADLREWARQMPQNRVHLLGAVHHEEAMRLMTEADAIVVPSRYETFGQVVQEAMAAARPIVATSVGGIPELFRSPEDAFLAEPEPRALALAIEALLAHPENWGPMGLRNAQAASNRTWAAVAARYGALYRSLLVPHQSLSDPGWTRRTEARCSRLP